MLLRWMALALIVVPVAAMSSWHLWHRESPLPTLAVVQAQKGDLLSAVTATGTIEARRTVDIKYDTPNLVTRLNVKEGDRVVANQPVATMDSSLIEPVLAQARETLQKDQANLLLAQASLRRAETLFDEKLLARVDLDTARANYGALLHQTEADRGAIDQAEEQIRRATLRSPINGVILALYVHEGEMLGSATAVAGFGPNAAISKPTNTLMTVAEDGDLEVDADVNAVDMGGVVVGQTAKFTVDAFQPLIFAGKVRSIALQPTVTNNVTTYRVVVSIPRPRQFRIGMPASIMLFRTVVKNAVLIPSTALLREGSGSSVFVLNRETPKAISAARAPKLSERTSSKTVIARKVRVRVLGETSSAVAATGGIKPDDWVVLNASMSGTGGDAVTLIETEFKPNPDPTDLRLERTARPSDHLTSTLPGPQPKGLLQQLLSR